jgi:hypothetical protein
VPGALSAQGPAGDAAQLVVELGDGVVEVTQVRTAGEGRGKLPGTRTGSQEPEVGPVPDPGGYAPSRKRSTAQQRRQWDVFRGSEHTMTHRFFLARKP